MVRKIGKYFIISFIWAWALIGWPSALAATEESPLNSALEAYQNADYERALAILDGFDVGALPIEQQTKVYYLKGTIYTALGDTPLAERNFQQILAIDPNWPPPDNVSPKMKRFFTTEKERATKILAFSLRDRVVVLQDADTFFELTTNITNLKVELHIITQGANGIPQEETFAMSPNSNGYVLAVPASYSELLSRESTLSYYLTVVTKSGALFKVGTSIEPKSITIITPRAFPHMEQAIAQSNNALLTPPPEDREKQKKKRLAIGLGVGIGATVLTAAIVTTVVILATRSKNDQNNVGSMTLQVELGK